MSIKKLEESSLSRVLRHSKEHDCGMLTAFRGGEQGYSFEENIKRNKKLEAELIAKGHGVTRIRGKYPETSKTTGEEILVDELSFFTVDLKDSGNLKQDLMTLGEKYEQDSIAFVPKGGDQTILIGTTHIPDIWLKYGQEVPLNHLKIRSLEEYMDLVKKGEAPDYVSNIKGKTFTYESLDDKPRYAPSGRVMQAAKHQAKLPIKEQKLSETERQIVNLIK